MSSRAFALAVALATVAPPLSEENAASADTSKSRDCWRGHRAPVCRSFFLTEFGAVRILTSSTSHFSIDYGQQGGVQHFSEPDFGRRFQFTVGPMYNISPSRALGGTVSFSSVPNGFRAAIEERHRWWGPGEQALDLSAGPLRADVTFGRGGAHPGMTLELGVGSWLTAVVAPVVLLADAFVSSFEN